jgi:hypothetical protein
MPKNTIWVPNPDSLCQLVGNGTGTPGYTGPSSIGTSVVPVFATTIDLDPFIQNSTYVNLTGDNTNACTVSIASVKPAGAIFCLQFNSPAAGNTSVLTFGTGFRSTGTVQPTASKAILVTFRSDGTTYNETGRTSASLT